MIDLCLILVFLFVPVIAGGSTYIVISRPDGSTVSEIVQKADESSAGAKE